MPDISIFIRKLSKLKIDRSKGEPAPHKAVLLISVIQLIDTGFISDNRILITPELVARFKDNWHLLVKNDRFNPNFSLPFYHLKSDGFLHLKTILGREILLTSSHSIKSFSALKDAIDYAFFDVALYNLLTDKTNRGVFIRLLLDVYLNGQQLVYTGDDTFKMVERQILYESTAEYQNEIKKSDDEAVFVRSGVFKKTIPKEYNYTCCISGMKIIATREVQMIDACHIIPFSETHDDTIKNGISLSPNLHRAYDRFLITINENYEVIVSKDFKESGGYSIRDFHGKKIHLPDEAIFHPSIQNLNWHYEKFMQLHR